MKLACQEGLLPGANFAEKVKNAEVLGFEGIELIGRGLADRKDEVKAAFANSPVKPSSICAGFRGCPLDANKAERDLAWNDIKALLRLSGELGTVGLIMVPIFGPPRIPDLTPFAPPTQLEKDLFVELLKDAAKVAAEAKTFILVEPLNRYETHLLRKLQHAVEICERVNHPNVVIMADFFHMHIEEEDTPAAIKAAGKWIQHVHLADNTRMQPGTGDTDFAAGFAALKKIKFDKYMALECGITGPDRADALKKCVRYLKKCIKG